MGRGRAKAKQTKVARELKYRPIETDFDSLQQELNGGAPPSAAVPAENKARSPEEEAYYADLAARYADYDDGSSDDKQRR